MWTFVKAWLHISTCQSHTTLYPVPTERYHINRSSIWYVRLFGHVCRVKDDRLLKVIMLGLIGGVNRRGRPRQAWIHNIKEWRDISIYMCHMTEIALGGKQWRMHQDIDGIQWSTNGLARMYEVPPCFFDGIFNEIPTMLALSVVVGFFATCNGKTGFDVSSEDTSES